MVSAFIPIRYSDIFFPRLNDSEKRSTHNGASTFPNGIYPIMAYHASKITPSSAILPRPTVTAVTIIKASNAADITFVTRYISYLLLPYVISISNHSGFWYKKSEKEGKKHVEN